MNWIISQIPNSLTLGNVFSGCIGIWMIFLGKLDLAFYALLLGTFFDFFDGFVARMLKVSSPLGKQLDSLADMVTFGVLPGFFAMWWIENSGSMGFFPTSEDWLGGLIGLLLPISAAVRLGRFNLDETQTLSFKGVPTPAMALFFSSVAFLSFSESGYGFMNNREVAVMSTLLFCFLMNAPIRIIALKFDGFAFKDNELKWILVISTILLLVFYKFAAIPMIIGLLIVLSFFQKPDEVQS